ncbi:MAG TPA: tryptophan synthase subunit alpha [Pyrinomonadaceae bacterium]|nr:tryptophan synthase subunit alpha [Pyrinomonadaceae bacterium]
MSRITDTFTRLHRRGRRALIPFIMAGDPDLSTTRELVVELAHSGADIIELGVPFSDPIADGPVIQRASQRALQNPVGVSEVLEVVKDVRAETEVPLILFSYLNPLLRFGAARLAQEAARAGVDGLLITDLTPDESEEFHAAMNESGLESIYLAAPTSTDKRLRLIAERARGFIYAVSRTGVTGARQEMSSDAEALVARLRALTSLPVAVGFGISSAEQVADVWRYADGAVVGSAIVAEMERREGQPDFVTSIGKFTRSLLPVE